MSIFLRRTPVIVIIIGSMIGLFFLYIFLEANFSGLSNSITLVVEIGVGIVIAIIVYRSTKVSEYKIQYLLNDLGSITQRSLGANPYNQQQLRDQIIEYLNIFTIFTPKIIDEQEEYDIKRNYCNFITMQFRSYGNSLGNDNILLTLSLSESLRNDCILLADMDYKENIVALQFSDYTQEGELKKIIRFAKKCLMDICDKYYDGVIPKNNFQEKSYRLKYFKEDKFRYLS